MCCKLLLCTLMCMSACRLVCGSGDHSHIKGGKERIHSFFEITESVSAPDGSYLPLFGFEQFLHILSDNLNCPSSSGSQNTEHTHSSGVQHDHANPGSHACDENLCINATELYHFLGANMTSGLTRQEFLNASVVVMYYITKLDQVCHTKVNMTGMTLAGMKQGILDITGGGPSHPHIHSTGLNRLLTIVKSYLSNAVATNGADGNVEAGSSMDHDHAHGDDHDHDDGTPGLGNGHLIHPDLAALARVVEPGCISADGLLFYVGQNEEDYVEIDELEEVTNVMMYLLYIGAKVEEKCRLLPPKKAFIDNLFAKFGGKTDTMTTENVEMMMKDLQIMPEHSHSSSSSSSDGAHSHGDHGHDHRRKRSISDAVDIRTLSRSRREAEATGLTKCYSAAELMSLYEKFDTIGQQTFTEMCPALISQKLYADCSHSNDDNGISDREKYGYSTIAIVINFSVATLGALFIPFAATNAYQNIMATLLGLGAGALLSDSLLHLIPMAYGLHGHDDHGHDHGQSDDIVVEDHIYYTLVIFVGLYVFYVLETIMNQLGQHTHSHDILDLEVKSNGIANGKMTDMKDEDVKEGLELREKKRLTPLAIMVVLGGAIHNFTDGLAIAGGFAGGITSGISTAIAVFCHEIPHELGDVAILVKSGQSLKKAVCLNIISDLPSFVGLYVGLALSSSFDADKWIFSLTAGMFLYISLVDLIPTMIKTKKGLHVFLNNVGILLGLAIMLLIAIFEHHITV